MTKTLFNLILMFLIVLLAAVCGAQTILPMTTLSAAVANQSVTTISLTSVTGVVATSTVLFVADGNGEAMFVNSVNTTAKTVGVTRGYQTLGSAHPHLSGALVFIAQGNNMPYAIKAIPPSGQCTRTQQVVLPVISVGAPGVYQSQISDCVGGVWVNGIPISQNGTQFRLLAPNSGGTAYTSLGGTGTAPVSGTLFCDEIDVPYSKLVTGIGVMNGTVVGTDNHLVVLYDATGNRLANSATAGVLAANASTYQNISFTSQYYLVGPAQYFGCVQSNGTTATIRMLATGTQDTYLTTSVAGTFGTIPATITAPTTFTTAVGPYLLLF